MSASLVARQGLGISSYDDMDRALQIFCKGARLDAQEMAFKLAVGSGLGFTLAQCLSEIHIIEGRPSIGATLQLSIARSRGVRHEWLEATRTRATLRLFIPGEDAHRDTTWTIEMARESGLVREGKLGSNWAKFPDAMLRARCITTAIRMWCPEVLGMTLYDPDEIREAASVEHVAPARAPQPVPGLAPTRQIEAPPPAVLDARPAGIEIPDWADGATPLTDAQRAHVLAVIDGEGVQLGAVTRRHGQPEAWTGEAAAAILGRLAVRRQERAQVHARPVQAQPGPETGGGEE